MLALVAGWSSNRVSCAQSLVTYAYCCTTLVGVFLDLEEPECVVLNAVCACLYAASLFTVSGHCGWHDRSSCRVLPVIVQSILLICETCLLLLLLVVRLSIPRGLPASAQTC